MTPDQQAIKDLLEIVSQLAEWVYPSRNPFDRCLSPEMWKFAKRLEKWEADLEENENDRNQQ